MHAWRNGSPAPERIAAARHAHGPTRTLNMSVDSTARTRVPWQAQAVLATAAIGLVIYSQTLAFYGDEGFHLLAASLVGAGRLPYRDFFYQHPPLFPYVYAAWMRLAGETWRSAHLLSAFLTTATIWLVMEYVVARQSRARAAAGILAVLLFCLNPQIVKLGTVGHPYALCLFLSVLAFRLAVHGIATDARRLTALSGVAAGAAASSWLLAAPILPVIALWILLPKVSRNRWVQLTCFVAGAAPWLIALAWFFILAPRSVVFDLFEYHLFYRGPDYRVPPSGALLEGLRTFAHWAFSWERLPATLFALVGTWHLVRPRAAEHAGRAEFGLAAAIAAALGLMASVPYPTFDYYYVVLTPFVCILACHGAGSLACAGWRQPARLYLLTVTLLGVSVLRPAYHAVHGVLNPVSPWNATDLIAQVINRVVPSEAAVYVPEEVYFVAKRRPPPGLENSFAPELVLPASLAASLRIVPQSQIDEWIKAGRFAAVWMEAGDRRIESLELAGVYDGRMPIRSDSESRSLGYVYWKSAH